MKFVEILFQIIICHQLPVVHCLMSDKLYKYQCCLLSLSRSDVVWSSVVSLTPCPQETGLTSLFTMICRSTHLLFVIWCTIISFTKIKIESSLTPCRWWDKAADEKKSITHKLSSWDNASDLSSSISLTHWYPVNIIRSCYHRYGDA